MRAWKRILSYMMCLFHSNALCHSRYEKTTICVHPSLLVDRVQLGISSAPHPSKRIRNIIVIVPTAAPHPRYQTTIISPGPPTNTDRSKVTHQAYTYYPYNAHSHSTHTPSYNATHYPTSASHTPKPHMDTKTLNIPIHRPPNRHTLPVPPIIHTPKRIHPPARQLELHTVLRRRPAAAVDRRRAADDGAALRARDGADVEGFGVCLRLVEGGGGGRAGEGEGEEGEELHFGLVGARF